MTEEELQAIEARVNAATPGPWEAGRSIPHGEPDRVESWAASDEGRTNVANDVGGADLAFIAHAREDIPALVAEVRWMRDLLVRHWDCGGTTHESYCLECGESGWKPHKAGCRLGKLVTEARSPR